MKDLAKNVLRLCIAMIMVASVGVVTYFATITVLGWTAENVKIGIAALVSSLFTYVTAKRLSSSFARSDGKQDRKRFPQELVINQLTEEKRGQNLALSWIKLTVEILVIFWLLSPEGQNPVAVFLIVVWFSFI